MSPVVYDIAAIIILLVSAAAGYKRGMLKALLNGICLVLSFALAAALSGYEASSSVYDKYFRDKVTAYIDSAADEAKEQVADLADEKLREYTREFIDNSFGGFPQLNDQADSFITDSENFLKETYQNKNIFLNIDTKELLTNPVISGKIKDVAAVYSKYAAEIINSCLPFGLTVKEETINELFSDDDAAAALINELLGKDDAEVGLSEYIESRVVRPMFIRVISSALWVIVFTVSGVLLRIIVRMVLVIRRIAPIKVCDSLLGGVLGAAAGGVIIAAVCGAVMLFVNYTGGTDFMNESIFEKTFIFGKIYNLMKKITDVT